MDFLKRKKHKKGKKHTCSELVEPMLSQANLKTQNSGYKTLNSIPSTLYSQLLPGGVILRSCFKTNLKAQNSWNWYNRIILPLLWFVVSLSNLLLLFSVSAWADVDTLRPRACVISQRCEMTMSGCSSHPSCLNEVSPDDDGTYVYTSTNGMDEELYQDSVNFSSIDSIKIRTRVRKTGLFAASNAYHIGHIYWDGDAWQFRSLCSNKTANASYTTENCLCTTDEGGNPWTSSSLNARGFGVQTNVSFGSDQFRFTWMEVIVYGTAQAGGKRKPGGMVQDEDNRAQAEGGIAR